MIKHGRWRGQMPFRCNRRLWTEPLAQQGRTGEPSLATILELANRFHEAGRGKSKGSFTEYLRHEFDSWRKDNGLTWDSPLTFEYRMYRHRTVMVVMRYHNIFHHRLTGDGSRGFVLTGEVLSIDGAIPDRWCRRSGAFCLTRIVGQMRKQFLAITEVASVSR